MSFIGFPTELPHITKAVDSLLAEPVGPPPDTRSVGEKTLVAFNSNSKNLDAVRPRDWRHVPYALWLDAHQGLHTNLDAVDRYIYSELPKALDEARRPMKWARPLFFTYVEKFNPRDAVFKRLAEHAGKFFDSPKFPSSPGLINFVRTSNLFHLTEGPKQIAKSIQASKKDIRTWVANNELWPSFLSTPFAEASFHAYLNVTDDIKRSIEFINTTLDWAVESPKNLRYSSSRARLADALLLPWRNGQPSDQVKSKLIAFLINYYDDPRIKKNLWQGVSAESIQVLISWINGRTLDAFFRILEATADSIWQYRQKFWNAYFKQGHIDEVWVALGSDAANYLRRLDETKQLKYANLLGVTDATQSVLLIRIGQIVFCEWSHNGRLRAQRVDAQYAPKMYESYYYADNLRFTSLDFNNKQTQDPGLVHFSSQTGGWQDRARLFIQKNIGLKMSLKEVT